MALSRLRFHRLDGGLTLFQLAARSGVSMTKLSEVERGLAQANEDERRRLCRVLAVDEYQLFAPSPASELVQTTS
jgi:transcriptional regulator with XRE-family HTH domain